MEDETLIDIHCTGCSGYGQASSREVMPVRCPACGSRIVESARKDLKLNEWKQHSPSLTTLGRQFPRN